MAAVSSRGATRSPCEGGLSLMLAWPIRLPKRLHRCKVFSLCQQTVRVVDLAHHFTHLRLFLASRCPLICHEGTVYADGMSPPRSVSCNQRCQTLTHQSHSWNANRRSGWLPCQMSVFRRELSADRPRCQISSVLYERSAVRSSTNRCASSMRRTWDFDPRAT